MRRTSAKFAFEKQLEPLGDGVCKALTSLVEAFRMLSVMTRTERKHVCA